MKALTEICDRLVALFVPRATALADECQYVYWCQTRSCNSSPIGKNRMKQLRCASGYVGRWQDAGCCCPIPPC